MSVRRKRLEPAVANPEFDLLENAAELILNALPNDTMRSVLRETARTLAVSKWMLIAGILQRAYDTGEHSAPVIDPLWLLSSPAKLGAFGEVACAKCGATFIPRWPGESYCGNTCGTAAYRDRLAVDRETAQPPLRVYSVGEEPDDVARSTVRIREVAGETEEPGELGGLLERESDPIVLIEQEAQASLGAGE